MMVSEGFEVGDPVWAKMKGYPPWPARVVEPPSDVKPPKNKKAHFVYFFGTGNFAWILDENISPHSESMLSMQMGKKKNASYQSAIDDLVAYSKTHHHKKVKKSPVKIKKEKNEGDKPRTKIVKVINSVSKKPKRKVLMSESPGRKEHRKRKRSLDTANGSCSSSPVKISSPLRGHKLNVYDIDSDFSLNDVPHHSSFYRGEQNTRISFTNFKHVKPSQLKFGFIGLGMMGRQIVKSLLESGHNVTVWNRTLSHCDPFVHMGAGKARSPAELVMECDITFSCVADPEASKVIIFGPDGVLMGLEQAKSKDKGYVEMTSIDPGTSMGICEAITKRCGVYLEAPLCGTSKDAEAGTLLILAAGDSALFKSCETCFHAFGKNAYYVSCDVGDGSRMSLILSMLSGTVCGALAEAMVLVDRLKLQKKDFLTCIEQGPLGCKNILEKAQMMTDQSFRKITALKHIQKDINLSLSMGNHFSQHMPVNAVANEVYKRGRLRKFSNEDMSAVYKVARF